MKVEGRADGQWSAVRQKVDSHPLPLPRACAWDFDMPELSWCALK